jgi:hypothetical protein
MNYLNPLWLAYGVGILVLAAIGGIIRLCGRRGKAYRAFLAAATSGIVIFCFTYALYIELVPVPVPPPHHGHSDDDLLSIFGAIWSFLFDRAAPYIAYYLGLYCDPVIYGAASIPIAFIASLFFPCEASPSSASLKKPSP